MIRVLTLAAIVIGLAGCGCAREERGPVLAGGREVKSWVAEVHHPDPRVRRQAVLKLGNVGDADPAAAEALAAALNDTDALVRRDAVMAVVKLSSPGPLITMQLKSMSASDRDPKVRDVAKRALVKLNAFTE
jgi:vesicle coat complex subunit